MLRNYYKGVVFSAFMANGTTIDDFLDSVRDLNFMVYAQNLWNRLSRYTGQHIHKVMNVRGVLQNKKYLAEMNHLEDYTVSQILEKDPVSKELFRKIYELKEKGVDV